MTTGGVAVWGAEAPLAPVIAAGLRARGAEASCVTTLGRRLPRSVRSLVLPLWDGLHAQEPAARRAQLLADTAGALDALARGRLDRLVVLSTTTAYGPAADPVAEDGPLLAREGDTAAADAVAAEQLVLASGLAAETDVLRPAPLVGPGCEGGLLARHLAGPRLLVVRGTAPRWQVCHVDDLVGAVDFVLGLPRGALAAPAAVASAGVLSQDELEAAAGRKRLELPQAVAEATAARLRRTRLSTAAPDELPHLVRPTVVAGARLAGLGFEPAHTAAAAVAEQVALAGPSPGATTGMAADAAGPSRPQAATLAGATVAVVGSAALLRRARRQRRPGG